MTRLYCPEAAAKLKGNAAASVLLPGPSPVRGGSLARADTVLVLPFFNESTTQNIDWIGESIAETIRESLSAQGVLVLSREDRMEAYRRLSIRANAVLTHASVIKLGEALDASQVIYGHFEISAASQPAAGTPASPEPLRMARAPPSRRATLCTCPSVCWT